MAKRLAEQAGAVGSRGPAPVAAVSALAAVLMLVLLGGATRAPAAPPQAPAASSSTAVAPPESRQDPLVARINGHELRLSDVYASIESLSLGDQIDARDQLGTYIEAMINEEVLFQWALRTDFASEPALRQEVKDVVVRHLIEKHVRSQIQVSEADARAYYDANPSLVRGEHVRVRRILLRARPQCERLKARIDSEEEFIAAARKHSLDQETRRDGGDVGLMMRGENPPPSYEQQFFDMEVGEMRIFDVPQGCMLVRSVYYVNPPLPPFAAVKNDLMQYLRNRQEVRLVEKLFQQASEHARVERNYRESRFEITVRGGRAAGKANTAAQPTQ